MESELLTQPTIRLRQFCIASETTGWRNIGWEVENIGARSVKLTSVRLPHGQFRSPEKQFDPPLDLAPGEAAHFQTSVYCDEPMGFVTENAFLIFNATWLAEEWRIFVRVRVVVNAQGEPVSATESVTTQKVGFSGVPN